MAYRISQRKIIILGLVVLILSSLACNLTVKTQPKEPTKNPAKTSTSEPEVYVIPTKVQNTAIPTEITEEAVFEIEVPTDKPAGESIIEATVTKKPIQRTATRTASPPTATKVVIRQATLAVQPTTGGASSGGMTVTAATGNLFVRRGPGTTYNIVGGFSKGVTTKAVGRNEKNDWLAIEIPLAKGVVGWISMGLGYAQLNGDIQSLPLYPFDAPKDAFLRNCTLHDMTTRPGQWNLPAKTTQKVSPGEYQILDMYTSQKMVQEVVLKEGNTVSIKVDGDGLNNSCP